MAIEVIVLDHFRDWYEALPDDEAAEVTVAIEELEEHGVRLGFPSRLQSKGHGSHFASCVDKLRGDRFASCTASIRSARRSSS